MVLKVFNGSISLECLRLDDAIEDFSHYPVYSLFLGKLEYLTLKNSNESEFINLADIQAKRDERIAQDLLELDKEMTKIIGIELETRKLDRLQPQNSDVHLPFSGLLQKKTGTALSGSPSILLKKKKKLVLKTLSNK